MNLPLLLLIAGGGYFILQGSKSKSKSSSKSEKPKPAENGKPAPVPENTGEGSTYTYKCGSLKIKSFSEFQDEIDLKITAYITKYKIDKQNIFATDPVEFSKKFINDLNPVCNKLPAKMTENERMLYFMINILGFNEFERFFALPDYSEEKYPDLYEKVGSRCQESEDPNEPVDIEKCKYVFDAFDPEYAKWKDYFKKSQFALQSYLGLVGKDAQLKMIAQKLQQTGQYP